MALIDMQMIYLILIWHDWYAINVIIMLITLFPDSLAPFPFLPQDCLKHNVLPYWMGAILQYDGYKQYSNLLNF